MKIDTQRRPEDWTLEDAQNHLMALKLKTEWQASRGRPYRMVEITAAATMATWEIVNGDVSARRKKQLVKIADELTESWDELKGIPTLTRSLEHKASLVLAAWSIKLLREAIENG